MTINLQSRKKHQGVACMHRVKPLEEVSELVLNREFFDKIGITRLGVTSGLDRVKINTASATLPDSTDVISIYSGKGLSKLASKVSAVMEAVERVSATNRLDQVLIASEMELKRLMKGRISSPRSFTEPLHETYSPDQPIEWVEGLNLVDGQSIFVPLQAVLTPYVPPSDEVTKAFTLTHTNGLASGFCLEEAISQALCEVIERDSVSLAELRASVFPFAIVKQMIENLRELCDIEYEMDASQFADDSELYQTVDTSTLPPFIRSMLDMFERAGLTVSMKYMPTDIGVPTFGCACFEALPNGSALFRAGYGTHPDATTAAARAITELAQSRVVDIQGAREDVYNLDKRRSSDKLTKHWLLNSSSATISFDEIPSIDHDDLLTEVQHLVSCLERASFSQVIVVPLKSVHEDCLVIRVLVPGIETWHPTGGESRLGFRGRKFAEEKGIAAV